LFDAMVGGGLQALPAPPPDQEEERRSIMKCRVVPNKQRWHRFTAMDSYGGEIVLVGSITGKPTRNAYLSVHTNNAGPKGFSCFSGQANLRRLAYAILKGVRPARRQPRKKAGRKA
jgi:hypothetical protein